MPPPIPQARTSAESEPEDRPSFVDIVERLSAPDLAAAAWRVTSEPMAASTEPAQSHDEPLAIITQQGESSSAAVVPEIQPEPSAPAADKPARRSWRERRGSNLHGWDEGSAASVPSKEGAGRATEHRSSVAKQKALAAHQEAQRREKSQATTRMSIGFAGKLRASLKGGLPRQQSLPQPALADAGSGAGPSNDGGLEA